MPEITKAAQNAEKAAKIKNCPFISNKCMKSGCVFWKNGCCIIHSIKNNLDILAEREYYSNGGYDI